SPIGERRTFRIDGQLPKLSSPSCADRRCGQPLAFGPPTRRNGPDRARRRHLFWRLISKSQFPNPRETFKGKKSKCARTELFRILTNGVSLDVGFWSLVFCEDDFR